MIAKEDDSILIQKKFHEYREFNTNWAYRSYEDAKRWMDYRSENTERIVGMGIWYNILSSNPDYDNGVFFTPVFNQYLEKERTTNMTRMYNSIPEVKRSLFNLEYIFLITIAKYIGISSDDFYKLPRTNPNFLRELFDLEDLVWRLVNYDLFTDLASEQDELLSDRSKFEKNVLSREDK